jgi:protoheme IX farnesyltransferase
VKKNINKYLNAFLDLAKIRITFFVSVSTSIGYILYSGSVSLKMFIAAIGVFLLASGSSAINHYQERNYDALMERTKSRPIPAGIVSPKIALLYAITLSFFGISILGFLINVAALVLGIIALVWYNLFYTPLKRKYVMAVVPGSVIGAIPPVIGWVAAGGNLFDSQALALALFFFIWQIPHFWLLLMIYGNDYERAGYPTLTRIFSDNQLSRITFIWIIALATSVLLIPLFSISSSLITVFVLISLGLWLTLNSKNILNEYINKIQYRKAFIYVNFYVLIVVVFLSIDRLFL